MYAHNPEMFLISFSVNNRRSRMFSNSFGLFIRGCLNLALSTERKYSIRMCERGASSSTWNANSLCKECENGRGIQIGERSYSK